jgi:predicted Holliday junction resolvase-like endonuclease
MLDDPEAGSTWLLTLASVIVFTVSVLALSAMYFDFESGEVDEKITSEPARIYQELRLSQEQSLVEYGRYTVEDAEGKDLERIKIPITKAMEREVAVSKSQAAAGGNEEAMVSK